MLFAFYCKSKFKKGTMALILDEFDLPKTYYFANLNIAIQHLTRKGKPTAVSKYTEIIHMQRTFKISIMIITNHL